MRQDAEPMAPTAILVQRHLDGTHEAEAERRAFLKAHQGQPVIVCRCISARRAS